MKPMLSLVVALGGALFLSQSIACSVEEIETESDCFEYCRQAAEGDGDVDRDQCEQDCEDTLDDCMADEREEAQNRLDECSEESCDEFLACTIDAGAQCFFGL